MDNSCPCSRECPDRTAECHGTCGRYAEWSRKNDERRETANRARRGYDTFSEDKIRMMWRNQRYSRRMTYNRGTKDE